MGMRIGEFAERTGVSVETIRHYERIGVLPKASRTAAGYREYSESALPRARLVRNALRFGFSLKQLGTFLGVRQAGGAPCKNVRAAGAQVLAAIERQMVELTEARESVQETLKLWDERLKQTPEGQQAHLLEALPMGKTRATVLRRVVRRENRSPR